MKRGYVVLARTFYAPGVVAVVAVFLLGWSGLGAAESPQRADVESLVTKLVGPKTGVRLGHVGRGDLSYVAAPAGGGFSTGVTSDPADAARAFLLEHASAFGIRSDHTDFQATSEKKSEAERAHVRLRQTYAAIPVFAGEAIVQVGRGNQVECVFADILRDTESFDKNSKSTIPVLDAQQAVAIAVSAAKQLTSLDSLAPIDTPTLMIYSPEIVGESGPALLAWVFKLAGGAPGEFARQYIIAAHDGHVALHFSLVCAAKNREIYDANNTNADPGTLVRGEAGPPSVINEANLAHHYLGDTYDFFFNQHGRDSFDNAGATLSATIRHCDGNCPASDAFWYQSRAYFGEGFATDDVVSHEITHGVTENTSGLVYLNQSGAINESFSDIWGEFVDLTNTGGNDDPQVKWLIGEDIPVSGAIRSLKDPTLYSDPDSTCSPNWTRDSGDNGGVHTNSGVNNKLCYLLTDGDTFNGQTVFGMGIGKVAQLYYEVQTNLLTSGANHIDLYHALTQAAVNLGFSELEKANLEAACQAVAIAGATPCLVPANDECENAIVLVEDESYYGFTSDATGGTAISCVPGDEPDPSADVWFSFTPSQSGLYNISACGATFDSVIGVFSGDCQAMTELSCNDDRCGQQSHICVTLEAGANYLVMLEGFDGETGNYSIIAYPQSEDSVTLCSPAEGEGEGGGEGAGEGSVEGGGEGESCAAAPYPSSDSCYQMVIFEDDYCCSTEWDGTCQDAYDFCQIFGEGEGEGTIEGAEEGAGEGSGEGSGEGEGAVEGSNEGTVEGESSHSADQNSDSLVNFSELLRVIQIFNATNYGCQDGTEDGYAPNETNHGCLPHASDYRPQDWEIRLSELLRLIQFYNSGGYRLCSEEEDGFCPG